MPPKSKKRVKKALTPVPDSNSEIENSPTENRISPPSTGVAPRGFLALPNELVSLILSYFPEIKPEHILMNPTFIGNWKNADNYSVRFDVLRALSQICRLAREIYLPLLWERFQVCLTNTEVSWYRSIGLAMERKSEGMLKSKHLWPYVKVVTVTLSRFQTSTVLPPFVKMLGVLSNVHTLEISHAHSLMTRALKEAFEGNVFPSIQKVILPTCAHEILRCCPEVREVTCNEDDGGRLVSALVHTGCKKLEVLRGVCPGPVLMKRLSTAAPPLRCIDITNVSQDMLPIYGTFPSLRVVEIDCFGTTVTDDDVKLGKDILRACANYKPPKKGKKSRRNMADGGLSDSGLADLYPEPRVVRVRTFPQRYYEKSPEGFTPLGVEDIPFVDSV
ncbi:unnamed protein product [Rhizoctonia solani]|uniref:F-box domain-containing protein n=1 Tax=Rhizoctonia solani TaxID=456999 RepID=A0A8H2XE66_9AGAM|nr:unnamed protein product [Rhizoctonia solani]